MAPTTAQTQTSLIAVTTAAPQIPPGETKTGVLPHHTGQLPPRTTNLANKNPVFETISSPNHEELRLGREL
jgi:hypothetical protein